MTRKRDIIIKSSPTSYHYFDDNRGVYLIHYIYLFEYGKLIRQINLGSIASNSWNGKETVICGAHYDQKIANESNAEIDRRMLYISESWMHDNKLIEDIDEYVKHLDPHTIHDPSIDYRYFVIGRYDESATSYITINIDNYDGYSSIVTSDTVAHVQEELRYRYNVPVTIRTINETTSKEDLVRLFWEDLQKYVNSPESKPGVKKLGIM